MHLSLKSKKARSRGRTSDTCDVSLIYFLFLHTFLHLELIHMDNLSLVTPLVTMDLVRYIIYPLQYLSTITVAPYPLRTSSRILSQIQDINFISRFKPFHVNLFVIPVFHSGHC